jgi:hypothetical protein
LWHFITSWFFMVRSWSSTPNPQTGRPPLDGSLRLLIEYIRSYPPYLEVVSSIRNLRTHHTVVARNPPNMVWRLLNRNNLPRLDYTGICLEGLREIMKAWTTLVDTLTVIQTVHLQNGGYANFGFEWNYRLLAARKKDHVANMWQDKMRVHIASQSVLDRHIC